MNTAKSVLEELQSDLFEMNKLLNEMGGNSIAKNGFPIFGTFSVFLKKSKSWASKLTSIHGVFKLSEEESKEFFRLKEEGLALLEKYQKIVNNHNSALDGLNENLLKKN